MKASLPVLTLIVVGSVTAGRAAPPPRVFSLDPERLASAKARLMAGDAVLAPALDRLRRDADTALEAKPVSVMDKEKTAPSGDKHDYLSLAPYWWPDPARPDGLPYIRRDGQVYPGSRVGVDHNALAKLCSLTSTLALAYYFTGHEPYAQKAAVLLKTWFLDPATRMNPNLEYAQGVPGRNTGRGIGLIDTASMIGVTNALGLLDGSPAWTPEDQHGMQEWFGAFLKWMLTSKNGRAEAAAKNNHGTWYRAQAAAYALASGDAAAALDQVKRGRALIAKQIEPDGRQPQELARTKSYSYSLFNLEAYFTLAELGRRVDIDLYHYTTPDGRSLRAALDYLAPYLDGTKTWPGKQIEKIKHPDDNLAALLQQASTAYPDAHYAALLQPYEPALALARFQLLWPTDHH